MSKEAPENTEGQEQPEAPQSPTLTLSRPYPFGSETVQALTFKDPTWGDVWDVPLAQGLRTSAEAGRVAARLTNQPEALFKTLAPVDGAKVMLRVLNVWGEFAGLLNEET